jgi:hypothetical protein
MDRFAKVINGVVDNVVVSATDLQDWIRCGDASPGWLHDAGTGLFTPPPTAQVIPEQRHITPLALRRRFTLAERSAIEWAAVDRADTSEKQRKDAAMLRACLKDQEQAGFIDLDDADVAAGVRLIEELQLIAPGRASEILGAPVQPGERP